MPASRADLVAQLQEENYCDDLNLPAGAAAWSDAEVTRFFQSGGQDQPAPPAKRAARVRCGETELKLTLTPKLLDRSLQQSVVRPFLQAISKKRGAALAVSDVTSIEVGGAALGLEEALAAPAGTLLTGEPFTQITLSLGADASAAATATTSVDADPVARLLRSGDEFEALGLPRATASPAAVRKAFRQVSLVVHPDKSGHPQAAEAFRTAFAAMQTLADPQRQRARLRQLERGDGGGAASALPAEMRWWEGASVSEMEASFRMMEEFFAAQGAFGADQIDDNLWVDAVEAERLRAADLAMFVDARDATAFAVSHVLGALPLPGHTMEELAGLADHATIRSLRAAPAAAVVVYSDNGSKLSRCVNVSRGLRQLLPPERVRRLRGGLNGWKRAGLPVEGDARTMFAGQHFSPDAMLGHSMAGMHLGR